MIQQVNLYKPEFRPSQQHMTAARVAMLAVVLLVLVLVAGGWFHYRAAGLEQSLQAERAGNEQIQQSIERMSSDIEGRRPDPQLELAVARVTDTLSRRQRLLERVERLANNRSDGFAAPMAALARQVPQDLWLTGLTLQQDQVSLQGRTRTGSLVPVYLERLGEEPAFTGQVFGRFELTRSDDHPWIEFRVATRRDQEAGR
ncbi:PilN domain-containing protein [Marinobacter lacisalsi]|uniref:PilN domain-containing protein n=1 Tax=Marinobacter lacisalsi TaxID=475979 RepID=A0ABV8QF78_9GAMM